MTHEGDFEPKIVAFLCNWCSYAGADLAGTSRVQYPSNVRAIRVNCSGRVDPIFVIKALMMGADGVLVAGCHPGDCHYKKGNLYTRRRVMILKELFDTVGLNSERLKLEWVSASEANRFGKVINDFIEEVKKLGPNPVAGGHLND